MNNTLSKEKILRKHYDAFDFESGWMFDGAVGDVFNAMDEYAKQEAIAFSNFTTPYYAIRGEKQWQQVDPPFTKYTNDELYQLYLLHKQNKEQ